MKVALLVLSCIVFTTLVYSQDFRQQRIDSVCQLVKKYWAEKNATKIYEMTGDEFKENLSLTDFKSACNDKLFPMGEMKTSFESFDGFTNKYKAVFDSDSLSFYLNVDAKGKIGTLLFNAYENK